MPMGRPWPGALVVLLLLTASQGEQQQQHGDGDGIRRRLRRPASVETGRPGRGLQSESSHVLISSNASSSLTPPLSPTVVAPQPSATTPSSSSSTTTTTVHAPISAATVVAGAPMPTNGAATPSKKPGVSAAKRDASSPESLYRQSRVEYTFFPVADNSGTPLSLPAAQYDGNNASAWIKSYAALPCEACAVTDAGAYFEYQVPSRASQLAFVTTEQLKALRDKCETPQMATSDCWKAAGLQDVKQVDYPYGTYAYKPAGESPGAKEGGGAYLVLNADQAGALDITYGMAYFGLDIKAPVEPGGVGVAPGGAVVATRLKEVVQALIAPVTLKPANHTQDGDNGWEREALALGSTYSQVANGGLIWWANFNAAYKASGGGNAQVVFLAGSQFEALRSACPASDKGLLQLKASCWAAAGLKDNPATQLVDYPSGQRLERAYSDANPADKGGSCKDGWWLLLNPTDKPMTVTAATGNFGLRLPGGNPRSWRP